MSKYRYKIKETSTTGGSASSTPGTGEQYSTPFAFNKNKQADGTSSNYYKKLGYKLVPSKIKNSGLEVKNLFEEETEEMSDVGKFQQMRVEAFDEIESKLNNLLPVLSNAKNKTIDYYNDNPSSYSIVFPTDLIKELITQIEEIIKQ
jgi:hypothetical protein